ncbi:recombinase family protein [Tepidibacter formicigenes]|jgi:DNA invertase Pin-like site-specific DNA recombinase|uniref:Site-specific DNA recombinase n=1 Tax=Tepidibacter formicigenes DSM 15518 TaxID=1123349 RepID=A0A1M6KZP9_9FIRM|nr:recombinase family protein [Tepidibacter formicigenes]SHJ64362.1 Site-specific DNA recombinase [Tepidibacter formicigenes DSM 15518]
MEKVCMYLRKSRADEEAEKRGEGETLLKHKKALNKFAKENNLNIVCIREEIVSGESLMHRPEMLKLLKDVEKKMYDGVLCMDLDRLGRGNMQEQGLILETFKKSNTKIITPRKTYNLKDEFDEEYSEFEAFMARKELKIINRRLQNGRIRSVEEGNYLGTLPPYGYEIYYTDRYRTLKPHKEQAEIVKMIFDLYINHEMGGKKIANTLNAMGYKSYTGKKWSSSSVLSIIKNKVYTGRIQWKKTENKKSKKINQVKETRIRPKKEWIDVEGKHQPIISIEMYEKAQKILSKKYHTPYNSKNTIKNPLAGLIKCFNCNSSMVLRPYKNKDAQIMCYKNCGTKSSKLIYIEENLILGLSKWLENYRANWNIIKISNKDIDSTINLYKKNLYNLKKELYELENQKNNLHDLLERKIYNENTYIERSKNLNERIENIKKSIEKLEFNLKLEIKKQSSKKNVIPKIEKVIDVYKKTNDPSKKNKLLKSIIYYVEYKKEKHQKNDEFTLIIYPKLPKK